MLYPRSFTKKNFLRFSGFVALASLVFAYSAQYLYNVTPCILCYYERYIYWALVTLGALTYISKSYKFLFKISGVVIVAGVAVGFYHLGVEWHWWLGTTACRGVTKHAASVEEYREILNATPLARCDQVNWRLLGISATIWNLLYFLGFFMFWTIARPFKEC